MVRATGERGDADRVAEVAAAGRAAYLDHDWDLAVLDLVFDSLVDTPDGARLPVRRLRFAGHNCTVEVTTSGDRLLTVNLAVSPDGPVVVESHMPGVRGPLAILWSRGRTMTWMRPQLTSFVVRWPSTGHLPVRTAWVPL
ncbi:hypothetical protein [Kribbella sp. NPDC004536]|uniref:hypothetical protein n=1 Tax=Kribbella sp. NPDC004536 TaxID=3364106 RepID=UPI0036BF0D3E